MHFSDQQYINFVCKESDLRGSKAHSTDTEIWVDGITNDGIDRAVVVQLSKTRDESFTLSVVMKDDGDTLYSQITWDYYNSLSLGQLALLSKLIIDQLKSGQGIRTHTTHQ